MRKVSIIVSIIGCVVLVFASLANAQVPTSGNVFFGYSYYNADLSPVGRNNFNGWTGSLEGKVFPHLGLVADFSQTWGSTTFAIICPVGPVPCPNPNTNVREYNALFGPRLSVSAGKLRPFAEALFGVGHVGTDRFGSDTSFATGLGGGLDYRVVRPIALRLEGDYVQTRFYGTTQDNVRLSTGIVFRF